MKKEYTLDKEKAVLTIAIYDAKQYLDNTDYKFNGDYEPKEGEDLEEIKNKRSEARKFIRDNK